ncbi:MAG TPA: anti-sigma factor [Porphyromonadaceae bacterium]|jgi:ferric-dicitrate binding protein FerR (iron transport regulator)|nr:anti-sigma factor [Porphyromonadaceae bacterium]HCM21042.1 anti-sigma factor [Porphyromonadaceae bacterium]
MNSDLIKKYLEGNTTQAENREIYRWIKQSPENEKDFENLRRLYDITLWQDVSFPDTSEQKRTVIRKRRLSILASIAAAFIIGAGLFYLYQSDTFKHIFDTIYPNEEPALYTTTVPTGEYTRLVLDDGTSVWLNSKSTLDYPLHFSDDRRLVRLSGEGYFDVTHDPDRPFIVETAEYTVQVLGTEFNVRAYDYQHTFEASLLQGSVLIKALNTADELLLEPDQRAITENGNLQVTTFHKDEFLWREGILFIDNKTISEILVILEQYYDIHFIIDENLPEESKKYTGKFRIQDGVEHILNVLRLQNEFNYIHTNWQENNYYKIITTKQQKPM